MQVALNVNDLDSELSSFTHIFYIADIYCLSAVYMNKVFFLSSSEKIYKMASSRVLTV